MAAENLARRLMEGVEIVLGQPVARKLVRCANSEVIPLDRQEPAGPNPVVEDRRGERPREGIDESRPEIFFQHGSRPHLHTELSTVVDSSGHRVQPEYCAARRAHQDKTPRADPSHDWMADSSTTVKRVARAFARRERVDSPRSDVYTWSIRRPQGEYGS